MLRRFFGRHVGFVVGIALLAGVAALAASLATWTVDDPSLSYAAAKPVANILGFPGAVAADLLMQFLGLGAIALLLPVVFWGWRALFGGKSFRKAQLASWILATLAAAGALAFLPVTAHWPLPTGMGGVLGDLVARIPAEILGGPPKDRAATIAQTAFVLIAAIAMVHAAGFIGGRAPAPAPAARPAGRRSGAALKEPDAFLADEDENGGFLSVPLGALAHFGYSARAALARLFGRQQDEPAPLVRVGDAPRAGRRVEPRAASGAGKRAAAERPDLDDDFDDEDVLPPLPLSGRVAAPAPRPRPGKRAGAEAQPSLLPSEAFELPALSLLTEPKAPDPRTRINSEALEQNARVLEGVLDDFGIRGEIINVRPGSGGDAL